MWPCNNGWYLLGQPVLEIVCDIHPRRSAVSCSVRANALVFFLLAGGHSFSCVNIYIGKVFSLSLIPPAVRTFSEKGRRKLWQIHTSHQGVWEGMYIHPQIRNSLNLFKYLGTRRKSKEIYVLYRKPGKSITENPRTFLAKKSANGGFLVTQVLTAIE
jgi:hypothetical protein